MNDIAEKYTELREELDNKDPLVRYAKLKEELDQKDPIVRYQTIREEIDKIKADKEEKTLESLENLFQSLGGEEAVVRSESKIARNAEERQKNVVEEPIGDAEKIDLREEEPTETKKENLTSGLESIVDVISKQEAGREKLQEEIDPVSARIEKLEKWIQKIAVAGPGSGEVRILTYNAECRIGSYCKN